MSISATDFKALVGVICISGLGGSKTTRETDCSKS